VKKTDEYKGQHIQDVLDELQADLHKGLDEAEAQARLKKYGPNQIEEKEEPPAKPPDKKDKIVKKDTTPTTNSGDIDW